MPDLIQEDLLAALGYESTPQEVWLLIGKRDGRPLAINIDPLPEGYTEYPEGVVNRRYVLGFESRDMLDRFVERMGRRHERFATAEPILLPFEMACGLAFDHRPDADGLVIEQPARGGLRFSFLFCKRGEHDAGC